MRFSNEMIDFMPYEEREKIMHEWFLEQFEHAIREVKYLAHKYSGVNINQLRSMNDALKLPVMDKEDLRFNNDAYHLVPINNIDKIRYCYSTSGTTGKPADIFFSQNDWNATKDALLRCINGIGSKKLVVFNSYRQDHISSLMFNEAFRSAGGLIVQRKHNQSDKDVIDTLKRMKVNVIIAPWNGQTKGGSINDFLSIDASERNPYINGENILALFCSSIPLNNGIIDELKGLGIKSIMNNYGLTEAGPLASSCDMHADMMHITYGPHYIEVVDDEGIPVKSNQKGSIRLFTLRGYENDNDGIREGTQLFNYDTGDEAVIVREPCKCGRTTPRIHSIERVRFKKEKLEAGCQVF